MRHLERALQLHTDREQPVEVVGIAARAPEVAHRLHARDHAPGHRRRIIDDHLQALHRLTAQRAGHEAQNVLEIARLSGSMYDKFVGFLTDMESIGRNIKLSQDAYDKALNKLSTGAGNLSNTAEKIKKLGAKATKQIDTRFLDQDDNL